MNSPWKLVKDALKSARDFKGDNALKVPTTVKLNVQYKDEDANIEFTNRDYNWTEMINKINYWKSHPDSACSRDVVTIQIVMDKLKEFCTGGGKRSNRGIGPHAIISSRWGVNAS